MTLDQIQTIMDRNAEEKARGAAAFLLPVETIASLCSLAAAGVAKLEAMLETVAVLSPKPGDLLTVRTPRHTIGDDEYAAMQAALTALATTFEIPCVAIPHDTVFELADGEPLADAVRLLREMPEPTAPEYLSRSLVRALGENGLCIMRPKPD